MEFALIGSNDESLRFVEAIAASTDHNLRQILQADHHRNELFELAPAAVWPEHWEELMLAGEVDAVIAVPHDDSALFEEQLRKLTQAGVPLIVVHPIHDSLFAYELEMMRSEAASVIVPFSSNATHPVWERLALIIDAGDTSEIGRPEQIVFERHLVQRGRAEVMASLARDITTFRKLIGDITSVNAVGGATEETVFANLSVSLVGDSDVTARWSVLPGDRVDAGQVTVTGSCGKAVLKISGAEWSLTVVASETSTQCLDPHNEAAATIARLERAMASNANENDWEFICHDLEVAEQVERSLRRKRTVELRRAAQTEEGTFKGLMSAGSCLMLLAVLVAFGVWAIVEGFRMPPIDYEALREQATPPPRSHLLLRLWPVYPLALFLLMQLLLVVAKKSNRTGNEKSK